jgi:hypothetical protein
VAEMCFLFFHHHASAFYFKGTFYATARFVRFTMPITYVSIVAEMCFLFFHHHASAFYFKGTFYATARFVRFTMPITMIT